MSGNSSISPLWGLLIVCHENAKWLYSHHVVTQLKQWHKRQCFWIFTAGSMTSCWAVAQSLKQILSSEGKCKGMFAKCQDYTINQASKESLDCSQSASAWIHLNILTRALEEPKMNPFGNSVVWVLVLHFHGFLSLAVHDTLTLP